MDLVCPLCNGLKMIEMRCQKCDSNMKDGGIIADYYDDYSPYLPISITSRIDGYPTTQCVHLFYCPKCGQDKRIVIDKEKM